MTANVDLSGKVAVVTGGSRGLGRRICVTLGEAGATVVPVARGQEGLDETVKLVGEAGAAAHSIVCDITDEGQVVAMAEEVADTFGRTDILVNNAGTAWERRLLETSTEEFRSLFDVNVTGMFQVTREIGRMMVEQDRGRVINIGSIMGEAGTPNLVHYCASKGAVFQFTRALASEWARYGITVNCLAPGYFPTSINEERLAEGDIAERILSFIPMRRFGQVEEIGPFVAFMASDATDYMTGQVILLDGGQSAR